MANSILVHLKVAILFVWASLPGMARAQEVIALDRIGGLHAAYVVPRAELNRVDVQLIVLSGAFDETGPAGTAHLLEHLAAFSADAKVLRQPRERDVIASVNGVSTIYTNSGVPGELDRLMKLSRAVLERPDLDETFMQSEIDIIARETLLRERQAPTRWLFRRAVQNLYGVTTGRASDPVADLPRLNLEDALAFHDTHYVPSNVTLIISGRIDPDVAAAKVETYFGDTRKSQPPAKPWLDQKPDPKLRSIETVQSRRIWADMMLFAKFVDFDEVDNSIDMQGPFFIASSIYQDRVTKALAFDDPDTLEYTSNTYLYKNGDLEYKALLRPMPGVALETMLERLEAAIASLRSQPVTSEEIAQARLSNVVSAQSAARRPDRFLSFLANVAADGFPPISPQTQTQMLERTTDEEVRAFLDKFAGDSAVSVIFARKGE